MRIMLLVIALIAALAFPGMASQSGGKEAKPGTQTAAPEPEAKKKSRWDRLKERAGDRLNKTLDKAEDRAGNSLDRAGAQADKQITDKTEAASQKLERTSGSAPAGENDKAGTAQAKRK